MLEGFPKAESLKPRANYHPSMAQFIDSVPLSGIIRIRDMMYGVKDPFRLDQGDVSFDAPETVKEAMRRAIAENRSHYVQTTGVPRLQELIAEKLRKTNGIPIGAAEEILVTNGASTRCTSSVTRCSSVATRSSCRTRSGRRRWATSGSPTASLSLVRCTSG